MPSTDLSRSAAGALRASWGLRSRVRALANCRRPSMSSRRHRHQRTDISLPGGFQRLILGRRLSTQRRVRSVVETLRHPRQVPREVPLEVLRGATQPLRPRPSPKRHPHPHPHPRLHPRPHPRLPVGSSSFSSPTRRDSLASLPPRGRSSNPSSRSFRCRSRRRSTARSWSSTLRRRRSFAARLRRLTARGACKRCSTPTSPNAGTLGPATLSRCLCALNSQATAQMKCDLH